MFYCAVQGWKVNAKSRFSSDVITSNFVSSPDVCSPLEMVICRKPFYCDKLIKCEALSKYDTTSSYYPRHAYLCIMYAAVSIHMYISWHCLCVSVHKHPVSHCECDKGFASAHCAMLVPTAPTTPSFFFIITPSQPLCNGGKNNTMLVLSDVACNGESLQNISFFCGLLYISFRSRRITTTVSSVIRSLALSLYLWNCVFIFGFIGGKEQL